MLCAVDTVCLIQEVKNLRVFDLHAPEHGSTSFEDLDTGVQVGAEGGSSEGESYGFVSRARRDGVSNGASKTLECLFADRS